MIEILSNEYHEADDYDNCGKLTIAILRVNGIQIPLCEECVNDLNTSLQTFNNTIFCHKCTNFIMSKSGWKYGGSCNKDGNIESKDAGYINCVDCMHTCKDAKLKI